MIRLPPTGIDISQNDLSFHLQQLDIYQGLLKQGFNKREIIKYFKAQHKNTGNGLDDSENDGSSINAASTYELTSKPSLTESPTESSLLRRTSNSPLHATSLSPERSLVTAQGIIAGDSTTKLPKKLVEETSHAPRQSSLLRFAQVVSSEASEDENTTIKIPFSPRSNITYRPRSGTYSFDQSEIDEDELDTSHGSPLDEFEHLSLSQELVPTSAESTRTTIRVSSSLRAEAESFTPLHIRLERDEAASKGKNRISDDDSSSDEISLPSSPPLLPLNRSVRSPSLPRLPRTPGNDEHDIPQTARRAVNQHLDGTFTVYNDSVAPRLQPQTPADLSRGRILFESNAAYTAPPGMIWSPLLPRQHIHGGRQPSGDQSPTARATQIRERRQREYIRGARIEGLRITRTREGGPLAGDGNTAHDFWREDLTADAVGEENFEDATLMGAVRRLRAVSGNRRAL